MKRANAAAALCAMLTAAACASAGDRPKPARPPVAAAPPEAGFVLDQLPDSSLPRGKCGMILWTLTNGAPSAVFRYVAGDEAVVSLRGQIVKLRAAEVSGRSEFGVSERQAFRTPEGLQVMTNFAFGLGFDGGVYLERALISIEDESGWKSVAPAAGIAGCRR